MSQALVHTVHILQLPNEIFDYLLEFLPKFHTFYATMSLVCKRFNSIVGDTWERFFLRTNRLASAWISEVNAEKRPWKWLAQAFHHKVCKESEDPFEIGYRDVTRGFEYPREDWTAMYCGEFKMGTPFGFGFIHYSDDIVDVGHFDGCKLNGYGRRWKQGQLAFSGTFVHGNPVAGERPQIYVPFRDRDAIQDGAYTGLFGPRGLPDGSGSFYSHIGVYYYGTVEDGILHGLGHYEDENGVIYDGEFLNGYKHGTGRELHLLSGITIAGRRNVTSGHSHFKSGTITYPSGGVYHGNFGILNAFDLKPDGAGIFTWPDGTVFIGSFHCGRRVRGMMTTPTGVFSSQEWLECNSSMLFNTEYPNELPAKEPPASKKRKAEDPAEDPAE